MTIHVISFNIRCCDDPNGNSIPERAPRLNSVISQCHADIIGFQECRPAWEPFIEAHYGAEYEVFSKYRCEEDFESTPILWRKDKFACIKTGYFWLSDTPEVQSRGWDEVYDCYRICVYAVLEDKQSGKRLTVMNTHFGFGDKGQISSAGLLYEYSKKISSYPTFVLGDFNMTPESAGYAAMTVNFLDANINNDLSPTYHGYHQEHARPAHIDYCFIDESLIPVNQKIMDDLVDGKYPSDHYGLYVTLQV